MNIFKDKIPNISLICAPPVGNSRNGLLGLINFKSSIIIELFTKYRHIKL
jgi:hypothetical protein